MPISGQTDLASLTESILAEHIDRNPIDANLPIPIYRSLADIRENDGNWNSSVFTRIQWEVSAVPLSAPSSGKAEGVEFAATEQTMADAVSLTGVVVGIRRPFTDEVAQDSLVNVGANMLQRSIDELEDQKDEDLLSLFTGATNSLDFSGLDFTDERLTIALGTYWAQNNRAAESVALVVQPQQLEDLVTSAKQQTGTMFGSPLGGQLAGLASASRRGLMGNYMGMSVYQSNNVPQHDASNWSAALLSTGSDGALLMPVWWDMQMELDRLPARVVTDMVVSSRYSVGIQDQTRLVEIITSKT